MTRRNDLKVDALIIGAGRAGTTSLYSMLQAHPEVCFSNIKEVHYFSIPELYKRGENYFHSFFRKCSGRQVTASADTYLLMDHDAIQRIFSYNPAMKLIVMLREPVARAYSSYNYSVNLGHHKAYASFTDSIEREAGICGQEDIVSRNNCGHFYGSLYCKHLREWAAKFPGEQILLLRTKDLKNAPDALAGELFSFLGISDNQYNTEQANRAAVPRSMMLERFLLDREHFLRKLVRKATPRFIKNLILGSGMVERFHRANLKEQENEPLADAEAERAARYFQDDLAGLKDEFGISF